jgi:dephospho-CoA kinase
MSKTIKIGLTGGMGAGKSLVLNLLAQRGIQSLQTDGLGHQVLKKPEIKDLLIKKFGNSVVGKNETIDRNRLARVVFQDPKRQKTLGKILHPVIRQEVKKWVLKQEKKSRPIVIVEVPLLFENGFYRFFDKTLSVSASWNIRKKRLLKKGWDLKEIRRRERFQWPQARKNRKADWVIYNDGGRKELKESVDRWFDDLQRTRDVF